NSAMPLAAKLSVTRTFFLFVAFVAIVRPLCVNSLRYRRTVNARSHQYAVAAAAIADQGLAGGGRDGQACCVPTARRPQNNRKRKMNQPVNHPSVAPVPASVLAALARYDTPTICNAMEVVAPERRLIGYTVKPLVCP